nr:hypothetical protein WG33_0054 [uncultured bacterium]
MTMLTIPPTRTEDADRVKELLFDTLGSAQWTEGEYLAYAHRFARLVEFADGTVVFLDMPTPNHQRVVLALYDCLQPWANAHGAEVLVAPMPVRLGPGRFREPDVMLYTAARRHDIQPQFGGPPDLVVEVLSPGTTRLDTGPKFDEYATAGIPEYWQVDTERRELLLFALEGDHYGPVRVAVAGARAEAEHLAGLGCDVSALFQNLT